MIKKSLSAVAAATLGLTLFAGGVAHAAEDNRPVKGSETCTDLVNGSGDVRFAVVNVQAATTDLNTALRATPVNDTTVANARAALADAQSDLRRTVTNVTDSLCKDGPATTTPKPTTVVPAPTTVVQNPTTVVERPTVIDRERISTVAVVPTRDDGSSASTSGSQITVVPEGSASTGQA